MHGNDQKKIWIPHNCGIFFLDEHLDISSLFLTSLPVVASVLQTMATRTGDLTCTTTVQSRTRASSGVLCLNPAVSTTR